MGKYEAEVEPGHPDMSQSVILDLVGRDKRVLDVGCAGGYIARALIRQGCVVSGVEQDSESAAGAKDDLERLVIGDLETLDLVNEFGEGSFDAVVFGDVLEHLRDPHDALLQARRLLTPRGAVVVSIPNIAHGDIRLALLAGRWTYTDRGLLDDTHLRFFDRDGVERLMRNAGFTIAEMHRVHVAMFGSEVAVRREEFPPELVEMVLASPESDTYQFVFKAYRDDLDSSLVSLRAAVVARELEIDELRSALATVRQESQDLAGELQVRTVELAHAVERHHALERSRTMRWTAPARRLYHGIREAI